MKYIQNNQKSIGNLYQPMDSKNLKIKSPNQKSQDFCPMFVISKKENQFKNL